jgi:hypothetical protein
MHGVKSSHISKEKTFMERLNRLYMMVGAFVAFGLLVVIAANADELDQATTFTFNKPVQIPGTVLPAGTYVFQLADNGNDPNVVQIFNSDGRKLYEMVMTNSTERQEPHDKATMTFVQQGPGKPDALLKWFYPGSVAGHEFLYPAREEKVLERDKQRTIAAGADTTSAKTVAATE